MSKAKELEMARRHLSPQEYGKYAKWRDLPWVERYPYLANLILTLSLTLNLILVLELLT